MAVTQESQIKSVDGELPGSVRTPKPANRAAVLLTTAACIVIVTAFAGHLMSTSLLTRPGQTWGAGLYVLLGMLLVAMVLAGKALLRGPRGRDQGAGIRASSSSTRASAAAPIAEDTSSVGM